MNDLIERDRAMKVAMWFGTSEQKYNHSFIKKRVMEIPSIDRPAKKWIKHSGDEWVVRVECPNCHRRFQFSPRLMWKCCPLCETKMNGMVKRKRIDDDNN